MTTRKKLNTTKNRKNSNVQNVEKEDFMEIDDFLLPDDDEFDIDDLDSIEDDDEFDSDDDGLGDDEFDSDDDDELDDDEFDSDDDELDDDEFDSDDDELDDDDDIFSDTVELENDPFAFIVELRQPALPTNKKMLMTAKEVDYKIIPAEESTYNNEYKQFSLVAEVKHPDTNKLITIKEFGTAKNARFIKLVTCLNNGTLPKSLSEIVGKKAVVTITHNTDEVGNVWDNIDTVEPYKPSSKKKAK